MGSSNSLMKETPMMPFEKWTTTSLKEAGLSFRSAGMIEREEGVLLRQKTSASNETRGVTGLKNAEQENSPTSDLTEEGLGTKSVTAQKVVMKGMTVTESEKRDTDTLVLVVIPQEVIPMTAKKNMEEDLISTTTGSVQEEILQTPQMLR